MDVLEHMEKFREVSVDYREGYEESDLKGFCDKVVSVVEDLVHDPEVNDHWDQVSATMEANNDWKNEIRSLSLEVYLESKDKVDISDEDLEEGTTKEEMRRMVLGSLCVGAALNFLE